MSSKLKYLKRYGHKKAVRKVKHQSSNLHVVDDDVSWKSTVVKNENLECNDSSDEAPLVAEIKDESKVKWQPLSKSGGTVSDLKNNQGSDANVREGGASSSKCEDFSPPRRDFGMPNLPKRSKLSLQDKRKGSKHHIKVRNDGNDSEISYQKSSGSKEELKKINPACRTDFNAIKRTEESEDLTRRQEFFEWGRG